MKNILELQQVSKTFLKSNFTLEDVTFSLPYGSILGFVGENGAGKTTTIGCILNTIKKRQWNDKAVWTRNAGRRYELT